MMQFIHDLGMSMNSAWGGGFLLLSTVSSLITLVATIFTLYQASKIRQRQKMMASLIALKIVSPDQPELVLPYPVLRSQLSRAELQGILALYVINTLNPKERYDASFLTPFLESGQFNEVLEGKSDELKIPCSLADYHLVKEQLARRLAAASPVRKDSAAVTSAPHVTTSADGSVQRSS